MMYRGLLAASALCLSLAFSSISGIAPARAADGKGAQPAGATLVTALAALEAGDAKKAEALFDRAIESRTLEAETLAAALVNRGLARQRLGMTKEAVADYSAALKLDALSARQRAVALYNRGLARRKLGQEAQAAEDFTSAIYLDPYFARAYFSRGNILFRAGQNLFALADYEKALEYGHPQPHLVHYALALVDLALDREQAAREALTAALKARPDFAPARRQLAALLKSDGVALAGLAPAGRTAGGMNRPEGARRLASLSGDNRTNLRRRARPAPVAPGAPEKAPAPHMKNPSGNAAPMMVASVTPVKSGPVSAVPAARVAAKSGKTRTAAASVNDAAKTSRAKAGNVAVETADAAANGNGAVTVQPVSAPPVEQNITPARTAQPATREQAKADDAGAAADRGTEPAETPRLRGWAIQLSSQPSEAAAWNHWKKLEKRVRRMIRGAKPVVIRAEIAGRGTFYRLRLVGFEKKRDPRRLCRRLKRRGTSCFGTRAGA